jgi:hypothetical protein
MSNALAIAAVSAVLKDLLDNAMADHSVSAEVGGGVTVTALPPDRVKTGDDEAPQLNLFLYHVSPNPGWRNAGLPSHDSDGRRVTNPPLALNLHYVLTAYGKNDFEAEILLGYAMQVLHEVRVLTREAIRNSLRPPSAVGPGLLPPALQALAAADLADQVELVKLTPEPMGTEEMYRVWSAFQTHYRPTAAYQASVVLIEGRRPTRSAPPVRERRLHTLPFRQPAIETVGPQSVVAGGLLRIGGHNLRADGVLVDFGVASAVPDSATDRRLEVTLPASLPAGVLGVRVIHPLDLGTPVEPHGGFESNVAAFVLRPTVTAIVQNVTGTGTEPRAGDLVVTFTPPVGKGQRVVVLLDERDPPAGRPGRAYVFIAPPREADPADTLTIRVSGVTAGTYLVRVRVDGAESLLESDATGHFTGPQVSIP